jgi:hypothetical protein
VRLAADHGAQRGRREVGVRPFGSEGDDVQPLGARRRLERLQQRSAAAVDADVAGEGAQQARRADREPGELARTVQPGRLERPCVRRQKSMYA